MRQPTVAALLMLVGCGTSDAPPPLESAAVAPPTTSVGNDGSPQDPPMAGAESVRVGTLTTPPGPSCQEDGHGCWLEVEGGTFLRGAQASDPAAPGHDPRAAADEGPVKQVSVHAFWIQRGEVTAGAWDRCVSSGACRAEDASRSNPLATSGHPDRTEQPVNFVSWAGAAAYCKSLGARLPTEAEWEYAARGPQARRFPWGDAPACPVMTGEHARETMVDQAHMMAACDPVIRALREHLGPERFEAETARAETVDPATLVALCGEITSLPVREQLGRLQAAIRDQAEGRAAAAPYPACPWTEPKREADLRQPTPSGILGMAGNLAEWTADWYAADAYATAAPADPEGPTKGTMRVLRGGSFLSDDGFAWRGSARDALDPSMQLPDIGLRCAWSAP